MFCLGYGGAGKNPSFTQLRRRLAPSNGVIKRLMMIMRNSLITNVCYSLPKMNTPDISKAASQDSQNEVQDFSMPSKKQSLAGGKGKLDDMLNKLKKKNNCVSIAHCPLLIIQEPIN